MVVLFLFLALIVGLALDLSPTLPVLAPFLAQALTPVVCLALVSALSLTPVALVPALTLALSQVLTFALLFMFFWSQLVSPVVVLVVGVLRFRHVS